MIFHLLGFSKKKTKNSNALSKLKSSLAKTRSRLQASFSHLLGKKTIDIAVRKQLERILLTCDVGPETTQYILTETQKHLTENPSSTADQSLRYVLKSILSPSQETWTVPTAHPCALLLVGVNGAGKTTTIGRIAHYFSQKGLRVLLAAGDTFRAAAIEQLHAWGKRINVPVIAHQAGGDSAAVLFEAMQTAKVQDYHMLIGDTAGRLHNQKNLMSELAKVKRVIQKQDASAPHETWLVIDATVGQNGLIQAMEFQKAVNITGIILTKLDGTAKGGIIFAISRKLSLPIRFIGVGEQINDLIPFQCDDFIDALLTTDT